MSALVFKNGQTSVVLRFKLLDSSSNTGGGLTGLSSGSSGLIISTIADNELTATTYTVAGSTIETITTLGTYAAPTATKCRFKEVDSTNHKGVYEFQFADARFAVSGAKSLLVSVLGAANLAQADFVVQLVSDDPYIAKPSNYASLSIDSNGRADLVKLLGSATALSNLSKTTVAIGRGTVDAGASTTSIPTSAFAPSGAVADQFKDGVILFDGDTATAALRGQRKAITASSNAANPTFTTLAFTTAPASGDTFSVI